MFDRGGYQASIDALEKALFANDGLDSVWNGTEALVGGFGVVDPVDIYSLSAMQTPFFCSLIFFFLSPEEKRVAG